VLSIRASLAFVLSAILLASPAFAARAHKAATSSHKTHAKTRRHHRVKITRRTRGQQAIQPARVTEIQQALIREHYLSSQADGKWDSDTMAAMKKYQADQGWQTKLMPDSRALKKLGLGPDYSNAINAKGATFTDPPPISTIPEDQSAGFSAAAGINQ
jgi:peptidoglycan hydrolase-like protein with peptidoglycan-binding domain